MTQLRTVIEKCSGGDLAFCVAACPLHVDMKGAIAHIRDGKYNDALTLIRQTLPFPGILGRICTHPCETVCRRKDVDSALAVMDLKRVAADLGTAAWNITVPEDRKERVAVVGGGPAGLMAAFELRKTGYRVTIFEGGSRLGGMMVQAVPRFRLPLEVLEKDLSVIHQVGIEVKLNTCVGESVSLEDLRSQFDAVFLAGGCPLSRALGSSAAPEGVIQGLDFLRDVNQGTRKAAGNRVVVIGGGNVAVDVALTARRLGAASVRLACLECRDEMPAFPWEIAQAVEEGIEIVPSCGPQRFPTDGGRVTGVELARCASVFDSSGRFSPVMDASSLTTLEADTVILAIGQSPDTTLLQGSGVDITSSSYVRADSLTLATAAPGIFAGGDMVTGPKSVIEALAAGKKAAVSIDRYLRGEDLRDGREMEGASSSRLKVSIDGVAPKSRLTMRSLPLTERTSGFQEIETGFSAEEAKAEAERCLSCECQLCVKECEFLKLYCNGKAPSDLAQRLESGLYREKPKIPYSCHLCGLCNVVCPEKVHIGEACSELRHRLVREKLGPLPSHKYIDWNLDWSVSDSFIFAEKDPLVERCERVFFPGCSLSGYSPNLVARTYRYLREKLPGTGVMLHCCGSPRRDLAETERFQKLLNGITAGMDKLGASEVVVCCANCYKTFKNYLPDIKLTTVYQVMEKLGAPQDIKAKEHTFTVFDPCQARWEPGIQDSVRALVKQMGYRIEEMQHSRELTRCCGLGGMVPYVDIWLAFKTGKRQNDLPERDIVTYCASCRESLANPDAAARPAVHLLDLMFNPDWEQARQNPPNIGVTRRQNQAEVKKLLAEELKGKGV